MKPLKPMEKTRLNQKAYCLTLIYYLRLDQTTLKDKFICNIFRKNYGETLSLLGLSDPIPNGYIDTKEECDEGQNYTCWVPCKDTWTWSNCKNECGSKKKCKKAKCVENCCDTCNN